MDVRRAGDLPDEARLANPRLSNHGDHLAAADARPVKSVADLLHLGAAADKAREPVPLRGLKPGAGGAGPHQLEDLNRRVEPLDRHRAERVDPNKALDQAQHLSGELNCAWRSQLLHAR